MIFDALIAVWFLAGAPSVFALITSARHGQSKELSGAGVAPN
jgi:hypothetical protein